MKKTDTKAKTGFFSRIAQIWNGVGIQGRIFVCFLLFILILLILLWLLQIEFLDVFYRMEKEKSLRQASDLILRNVQHSECASLVEHVADENNLCVLVTDGDMNTVFSADGLANCVIHRQNPKDLSRLIQNHEPVDKCRFVLMSRFARPGIDAEKFAGQMPKPDINDTRSLISIQRTTTPDGKVYYVFLNTLVAPVHSTVETIRAELLFVSIALVFIGFLLSSFLSRQISRPIVRITREARRLSQGEYTPVQLKNVYREVVELNSQLTQAAYDLHKVEMTQRELIANISHDLRTPLTLIEGYVEAMRDIPGENTPENLQIILDETRRLSSLVNTVLEYTRSKAVEDAPTEVYSLTQSIREIIGRYSKLMDHDGYRIDFHSDGEAFVDAHPLKVSQIIYNLINNALTYTGPEKRVVIRQTMGEGKVKIEVIDDGEGIPAEELPQIWNRYYRGKKPHVRPAAGAGMGLNIAKEILDSYHMEYGVSSQPDQGSVFWFVLPTV